jgi:ferrous iron transport protein A
MRTLDQLKPGERGIVRAFQGDDLAMHQRVQEMGVIEGSDVEVIRFAPLGDPIEIRVQGYYLSLRKREAALISVEDAAN